MQAHQPADSAQDTPVSKDGVQAPWPYITVGVVGIVVLLAVAAMVWLQFFAPETAMRGSSGDHFDGRDYSNRHFDGVNDANIEFFGVISENADDSLKVVGGGKKITVYITDDTDVRGDGRKLSIHDTIAVAGIENSDGTVTATHIMVVNDEVFERYDHEDSLPKQRTPSA